MDSGDEPFVLIAGAGIGGLAVALALHKAGHTKLRLVERSVSSPPTAAGINLQPHAVGVLYHLGIGDAACGVGLAPRHQCYFSSKGDLVGLKPAGLASNPDAYPQVRSNDIHVTGSLCQGATNASPRLPRPHTLVASDNPTLALPLAVATLPNSWLGPSPCSPTSDTSSPGPSTCLLSA